MSRFSRDGNFNRPERRPKPRPHGASPQQRLDPNAFRDRDRDRPPPRRQPVRRPAGASRIAPLEPKSGKQRRRMIKAASWRLAKLIHARPADVLKTLSVQPKLEVAFPDRNLDEHWGEACRLAVKIWRLNQTRSRGA